MKFVPGDEKPGCYCVSVRGCSFQNADIKEKTKTHEIAASPSKMCVGEGVKAVLQL